jgi:hypothetical protein
MTCGSRNSSLINSPARALLVLLAAGCLYLSACSENELKDAQTISSKEIEESTEKTYGVELIYSDSAKVKARMTAPVLLYHQDPNPWNEMPKGVTVIFYDEQLNEQNRIRSDYATRKEGERVTELRKNVVITTRAGDIYKSEQMFWNEDTHKFYSTTLLKRISKKGEIGYASSFESDENFLHPVFHGASGDILVPESKAPGN